MNTPEREDAITLGILEAIDNRSDVSQRHLADRLDVALGLANLYLKRCVRKGFIKIRQAPANRYFYYLTPKGFAEKSRLTTAYLSISFDLYRSAGHECARAFDRCRADGWHRLLLCGVSELAEIAYLRASEFGVTIIGTFDSQASKERFLDLPVWTHYDQVDRHDACLITALTGPAIIYDLVRENLPPERIFIPSLLRFSPSRD